MKTTLAAAMPHLFISDIFTNVDEDVLDFSSANVVVVIQIKGLEGFLDFPA